MSYEVHVRKNDVGETRVYTIDLDWEPHHHYWWSNGNMSCDCNRVRNWLVAGNAKDDEFPDDPPCGHTLFDVVKIVLPDGTVIDDIDSSSDMRE